MSPATFTEALQVEVAQLQAAHPLLKGALDRAFTLVMRGDLFPLPDGHSAHVRSQSDPDTSYLVNGTCDCLATQYRKEPCVHRYAFRLYHKAIERLMGDPEEERWEPVETVPASPAALPEAPASVNVRLTIAGREVQWTLRDMDEDRLATRLEALLARYPVPVPASPPASEPHVQTPQCPTHGALTQSKKGKGWYCPRQNDDGTWCKSRST